MMIFIKYILRLFAILVIVGKCFAQAQHVAPTSFLEQPSLKSMHLIEVEYIINANYPTLNQQDLYRILNISSSFFKQNFSAQVEFRLSNELRDIKDILKLISPIDYASVNRALFNFKNKMGDKELLIARTANALRLSGDDTRQARNYAKQYLTAPLKSDSLIHFSEALVETQLTRLYEWSALKNSNGIKLIDDSLANEYLMWNNFVIKHTNKQLIITNQLIASAEYFGNSVHSSIRGGVSNGFTSPSINSSSGVASVVSLFPFVSEDPTTMKIRDGVFLNSEARNVAIALMIVHELGHQIIRLGHPFESISCVMTPPKLLHFRAWVEAINPELCPLGSSSAMTPGAIKFIDLRK